MLLFCTLIQGLVTEDPNCVVLGDAVDGFSYKNLNTAFRLQFLIYLLSQNNLLCLLRLRDAIYNYTHSAAISSYKAQKCFSLNNLYSVQSIIKKQNFLFDIISEMTEMLE